MKDKRHVIVVDPTAFAGGSKIASETILSLLNANRFRITVLSADKSSWQHPNIQRVALYEPKWLAEKEQGIGYFIRHTFIALLLLFTRFRFGRIDIAIGASGPGVDLALYLLRAFLKFPIIQLIHGPVARSRTIARCLKVATQVYYLQTSAPSILLALQTHPAQQKKLPNNFHILQNGLAVEHWPSPCQQHSASVFWAASLLKWKGLDILLGALLAMPAGKRPTTHICYIKPQGVQLPISTAPLEISAVHWYESPKQLDLIRASANIFVSTSTQEPFGLSILEALAAGQCVLIPADGAYWDTQLQHNSNCIKYPPNDKHALMQQLLMLSTNLPLIRQIGAQAKQIAQQYRAEKQYQNVIISIQTNGTSAPPCNTLTGSTS